ncbi:MAG: YitT family protein [Clostridia bacterium]|nr:YitT family protein [Clostridia bacterium]
MTYIKKAAAKRLALKLAIMTVGASVYAVGVAFFLNPHGIAPGGLTGISVMINYFNKNINTGILVLLMNIPLMIAGLWRFGKEFLVSTIWSTVISSVMISGLEDVIAHYEIAHLTDNMILTAVAGGALMGVGMGIIFRQGGTTGGSDIVVKFLRQKYRHLKSGVLFIIIDSSIVAASALVYKNIEMGLLAGVTVAVSSYVFNNVLYGGDSARLAYIISDKPEQIAERLLKDLSIGATMIEGKGAFTGSDKQVIMCAAKNRVFPEVKKVVHDEDPHAFLIVSSANEIYGEGFKVYSNTEM